MKGCIVRLLFNLTITIFIFIIIIFNYRILLTVPAEGSTPLTNEEVKELVRILSGRHCRRFEQFIRHKKGTLAKPVDAIVEENNEVIFNTEKMLLDWLEMNTHDWKEKRAMLQEAIMSVRGKDVDGGY